MSLRRSCFLAVLVACLSCGDDDSATGPDDFLPVFTNSWRSTDDPDHTLNLISVDDFQARGAITGVENFNFVESNLDGNFEGLRVTSLTIHRATGDVTYTGRLLLPTILLLVSGADSIILFRPR
jgi:hypothetical protein